MFIQGVRPHSLGESGLVPDASTVIYTCGSEHYTRKFWELFQRQRKLSTLDHYPYLAAERNVLEAAMDSGLRVTPYAHELRFRVFSFR